MAEEGFHNSDTNEEDEASDDEEDEETVIELEIGKRDDGDGASDDEYDHYYDEEVDDLLGDDDDVIEDAEDVIEITVESLVGTIFEMRLSRHETISTIKLRLQRLEGIPRAQMHLLYRGKMCCVKNRSKGFSISAAIRGAVYLHCLLQMQDPRFWLEVIAIVLQQLLIVP